MLYIARSAVNNLLSVDIGRGSRLPAWATSMGRVLLSALPDEQLNVTLSRINMIRYTPHTLNSLSALREELARVRRQGYALADRQIEVGLCSLAVPLLSRNNGGCRVERGCPVCVYEWRGTERTSTSRFAPCRYGFILTVVIITV